MSENSHFEGSVDAEAHNVTGLPKVLPADSVGLLYRDDTRLALAHGNKVSVYALGHVREGWHARELHAVEIEGAVTALGESDSELLVVTRHKEHSSVGLLGEQAVLPLLRVDGHVMAFASAGGAAYAVVSERSWLARLVRINLRQRSITDQRELPHGEMTLAVDPSGQQVVLTDLRARTVLSLGGNLEASPTVASSPNSVPLAAVAEHPRGCCCWICCKPGAEGAEGGGSPASQPHTGDVPGGATTPAGGAPTGGAGVPSGGGGTVVANGGRVDDHPPGGGGSAPCGRELFYRIAALHRLGAYVLAADRQGRQVSVLTPDMNVVDEWHFGRGGAILLPGHGTATLLMHVRGTGQWILRDEHAYAITRRIDLTLPPPIALNGKTFIGQQTYPLSYGQPRSPTSLHGVLFPIIERGQSFLSPDLSSFGAFVNRVTIPQIKDFYNENSFGVLKDLTMAVFGVNVGPPGGPLQLPKAIADYYFPPYSPAALLLTKTGVTYTSQVVLDGREALTVHAKALDGTTAESGLVFSFFALAFTVDKSSFPVEVKFLGNETLTVDVTLADGTAKTLTLSFSAKTFDMPDLASVPGQLQLLENYLDAILHAAEVAAGIANRLFATPKATRIPQVGADFGRLVVTIAAKATTGTKLKVTSAAANVPGGDPMGLQNPIVGVLSLVDTAAIDRYMENAALLAQNAANITNANLRLLKDPVSTFDAGSHALTVAIAIADRFGGPGATVSLVSSSALETLYDTSTGQPNSASTADNSESIRDFGSLLNDVFTAAVARLRAAGMPADALMDFGAAIVMPLEPTTSNPADPTSPRPGEVWNVTALGRPFDFRGEDGPVTAVDLSDTSKNQAQLQTNWALDFMANGVPALPLICHEMGHALGFGDLYSQTGYRSEVAYLGGWSIMADSGVTSHHCGYHKLQAEWIPDGAGTDTDYGRVLPIGLPDPSNTRSWEFLLVPLELWRDSLVASARAAFGVGSDVAVVQLAFVDLGGDHATFGLIEARQPGAHFSQNLPTAAGGIVLTNCIAWSITDRIATDTRYRRQCHLLNPGNVLTSAGDSFDLALAPAFPVKGMTVSVVDKKLVEGDANVYRVRVTRENAQFVDLYFENPPVYYKNPDLWVDWPIDNPVDNMGNKILDVYPLGQPTDQGEDVRYRPDKAELNMVVARLRNRGKVQALNVVLEFFYFMPPGAGDGNKPMDVNDLSKYQQIGTGTAAAVPADPALPDEPVVISANWNVPAGFGGHTCLLVRVADYQIPRDAHGAAQGSDDTTQFDDHAQKNVDHYQALSGSPYEPIEFDFSVRNEGVTPELAYLEPDGLPYGMTLTITPPEQQVPAHSTVLFNCRLELDDLIIKAGCQNDQRFQILVWRREWESSSRWGGVEYEVQPRTKTSAKLEGVWGGSTVALDGTISPIPGSGVVRLQVDFENHQPESVTTNVTALGKFSWSGPVPPDASYVDAIAWFEGNRTFARALSNPVHLAPIILH
jgi:hypothetical protein